MSIARGFAGPSLLAMILFDKFGQHQPLNRQSERYAREGIELQRVDAGRPGRRLHGARCSRSYELIERACPRRRAHARRRHHRAGAGQGQDRDRAAVDLCARRPAVRRHAIRRPRCSSTRAIAAASIPRGISQAMPASCRPTPMPASTSSTTPSDEPGRSPKRRAGRMRRRKFFVLADIAARRATSAAAISPIAFEAVQTHRRDLRASSATINGLPRACSGSRVRARSDRAAGRRSRSRGCAASAPGSRATADVAKAMDYMLEALAAFTRFLDDGRICLTQQCRRARAARHRARPQGVAVRRLRSRRRACRRHVHADPDRQAQRRRSAGLARRRARAASPITQQPAARISSCPGIGKRRFNSPPDPRPSSRQTYPAVFIGWLRDTGDGTALLAPPEACNRQDRSRCSSSPALRWRIWRRADVEEDSVVWHLGFTSFLMAACRFTILSIRRAPISDVNNKVISKLKLILSLRKFASPQVSRIILIMTLVQSTLLRRSRRTCFRLERRKQFSRKHQLSIVVISLRVLETKRRVNQRVRGALSNL